MSNPTKVEREALLDLLLELGGPLSWTGPIPYNALAARHATAVAQTTAAGPLIPAQATPVDVTSSGTVAA
jgi:hypothetical protein